jgi:hypothetical protein
VPPLGVAKHRSERQKSCIQACITARRHVALELAMTPTPPRGFPKSDNFDPMSGYANRMMETLMGAALGVTRTDHTSAELRALSGKCPDSAQVRRLLALALVLDGRPRSEAAASA